MAVAIKGNDVVNVSMTVSECKNIMDMIEWHTFDWIRQDEEIDNFQWVVSLVDAWKALKAGVESANE